MGRYSLESGLVRDYGVATAAVYDRLYDLCREKAAGNVSSHDGFFWVRIPFKDFPRIFPFLSSGTVSKALGTLRNEGLVTVGHYDGKDERGGAGGLANWYTIT